MHCLREAAAKPGADEDVRVAWQRCDAALGSAHYATDTAKQFERCVRALHAVRAKGVSRIAPEDAAVFSKFSDTLYYKDLQAATHGLARDLRAEAALKSPECEKASYDIACVVAATLLTSLGYLLYHR